MSSAAAFTVWIVDDLSDNLRMVRGSFDLELLQHLSIVELSSGGAAIAAMQRACAKRALPDFVFLDFFLGDMTGADVLEAFQLEYRSADVAHASQPVVIAHSSERRASEAMVARGADFILPKSNAQRISAPIASAFGSLAALRWMRSHRRVFSG